MRFIIGIVYPVYQSEVPGYVESAEGYIHSTVSATDRCMNPVVMEELDLTW